MLGPFRIRNLPPRSPRRPVAAAGSAIARRASVDGEDGTVVSVNGDKYEQWIRTVPEAKLRYTDTDKDVITVGSKQELQDRLAEPVRKPRRASTSKQKEGTSADVVPLRPASPAMHVFEIDPIEAAIQLWQKIERETNGTDTERQLGVFEMDGATAEAKNDGHPSVDKNGLTLEDKRAIYFKNSHPPQLHGQDESTSAEPDVHRGANGDPSSSSNTDTAHVLTAKGVMQAQLAGEQLRERLGNPGPRIDRANAVNSWASYSQPPKQPPVKSRPLSPPPDGFGWRDTSPERTLPRPPSFFAGPLQPSSLPRLAIPGSSRDADAHLSEAVHGSLLPAFYENVQASLAKLSPEMVTLSGEVTTAEENATVHAEHQEEAFSQNNFHAETAEAAEITLSKMVFKSIGDMTDILSKMNSQFDAQLTPKLVSERLKSKEKLLPVHRQDTVRDLFTVRRAIEEFALELAETKQTLARFEDAKVFPENTNLVDFDSMVAAAYSFGRLVRSMDDMIIAARRGMLAARVEDGEPKFHTPRRLARFGYEDMWSVTIKSVPSSFTRADVQILVDEVRYQRLLGPLEPHDIIFNEGPERSAEIVINGIAHAQETWKSLISAPNRSLRPLSERQVNLTRKHYPNVYRCSTVPLKETSNTPLAPPSRADIDVARLKALQDRRAAWRKEFKARTQSVRFTDSAKIIDDVPSTEKEKSSDAPAKIPAEIASTFESHKAPAPSEPHPRSLGPRHRHSYDNALRAPRSERDLRHHVPRRALRPVQSQTFVRDEQPQAQMQTSAPVQGRPATYHSIRYPPGPFPPAPPLPSLPIHPAIQTEPKRPQNAPFPMYPAVQPEPKRPQTFYAPPPPPPPRLPATWLAKDSKLPHPKAPPAQPMNIEKQFPPPISYPRLHHQASDPNFAPLPSFPALEPVRLQSSKEEPQQRALPGAWPVIEPTENESSGAFFRRMMGRSPANEVSPISSPVLGATDSTKEPHPPVSPISPSPGLGRSSSVKNPKTFTAQPSAQSTLRRSATVTAAPTHSAPPPKSAGGPWSRRPYSQTFDGAGRRQEDRIHHVTPKPAIPKITFTRPVSMPPPRPPRATPPPPASDPAPTVPAQIKWCVNQLQELGYGDMHNGGMDRLAMYAQLADGELEATIDLIEEERQAWNEQDSGTSTARNEPTDI